MPDLKISQLPVATTPLAGTELVPIVQGGVTDQTTVQAIMTSTVPSGTANGVLYLNGSKVATSGSALTFSGTRLDVTVPTAYVGRFAYDATNYTDIGYGGTNTVAPSNPFRYWELNGSEQMRLTSTGLGIGTSSPATKLHVSGSQVTSMTQSTASSDAAVRTKTTLGDFGTGTGIGTATNCWNVYDYAVSAERMRLDSSGNLGLGVTPSAWWGSARAIQVGLGASFEGRTGTNIASMGSNYFLNSSGISTYINTAAASQYYQSSGQHIWQTAPSGTAGNAISFSQVMTLGGTAPALRVGVTADLAGFNFQAANQVGFSVHNSGSSATAAYFSAANNVTLTSAGNFAVINGIDGILFGAAATERARITSTGNVVAGGSVALATTATDGFLYVPTCAGTPTGTPTAITGMAPIVVDTTNNKMYFYSGGAWRDAGP